MRRTSLLLLGLLVLGGVGLVFAAGRWRIWGVKDYQLYRHLNASHSSVAGALWRGEIAEGDDVNRVLALARPTIMTRSGPFLSLTYLPGGRRPSAGSVPLESTRLIARDGRLVQARSSGCTFDRSYFDIKQPADLPPRAGWAEVEASAGGR